MNLPKAIEDLKEILDLSKPLKDKDYKPAIRLGIEALKKIQEQRNPDGWLGTLELPGETGE